MEILDKLNIEYNNISLYTEAFTHTSYSNEHSHCPNYERLEFLGDAVLELIISKYLFQDKEYKEGIMTKKRASYVCENALYRYASDLDFFKYIRLGSGEKKEPNPTILADVFEAFIGAMYLDKGFDYTEEKMIKIITPYIKENIEFLKDYKSELQELVQTFKKSVEYKIVNEYGEPHCPTFVCEVLVDGMILGRGCANSKKGSEQEAAREALSKQAKINNKNDMI